MPLINTSIPNFLGGVSQQPAAIRRNNEAEEVVNAIPSPVEGLIKRPPAEFISTLFTASGQPNRFYNADQLFVHLIERDENEKYLLYIANNGVYGIYDLVNNIPKAVDLATVNLFRTVNSPSERSAVTIGDVTFVANALSVPALTTNKSPKNPVDYDRECLVWIRQANFGREHIVTLKSEAVSGNQRTYTYKHTTRSLVITNTGTANGTNATTLGPVTLTYAQGVKAEVYPQAYITYGGSGNRVTNVRIVEDFVGLEQPLSSKGPGDSADETGVLLNIPTQNGVAGAQVRIKADASGEIGTNHVAESLAFGRSSGYIGPLDGIDGNNADPANGAAGERYETNRFNNTRVRDGVIWIKSRNAAGQTPLDFEPTVEDDFAGDGISLIRDTVERFEDLPPTAPHGYTVKVLGVPESGYDDYWVKFEAEDGDFSRGVWIETVAPDIYYEVDPTSLPVLVIRNSSGDFVVTTANGGAMAGIPAAQSATYKWTNRLVGDDDTNPVPSFMNQGFQPGPLRINGLTYYQGRLGILSGENMIFSETGQFFNFFRTTVLDLLDTDPIDVASSSQKSGIIYSAVPFNRDLILWTPTNQSVLRTGDVFTPRTVAISTAADYENQSYTCRPVPSANSIFFTYNNGGYVGLRELVPQPALDGSYLANDLTTNVSRFIRGIPTSLAASTHDNIVSLIANKKLYLYRYLAVNGERAQSAWVECELADSSKIFVDGDAHGSEFCEPLWSGFVESDLFVVALMRRKIGNPTPTTNAYIPALFKIRMGSGLTDSPINDWLTHLDCRARLSGTYSGITEKTTITLPYGLDYAAGITKVVNDLGNSLIIESGTPAVFKVNANTGSVNQPGTIVIDGDVSGSQYWVGSVYEMKYTFSTQYIKRGQNMPAMLGGRYQIHNMILQFAETGYFKVTTQTPDGTPYEYEFAGDILGSTLVGAPYLKTGQFRVPIFSKNDNITISIINNSFLPCKILSGEIEAEYTTRSSNM
jgi:membrane-associated protease RseP (regulator of RpoE activity)